MLWRLPFPGLTERMLAQVGFNLEVGGYFSVKRNCMSISGNTFVRADQVVAYCKALLEVFRWASYCMSL